MLTQIEADIAAVKKRQDDRVDKGGVVAVVRNLGTVWDEGLQLTFLDDHKNLAKHLITIGSLGAITYPAELTGERTSPRVWRVSVPINIVPGSQGNADALLAAYVEKLRFDFLIEGETNRPLYISDILPSTAFLSEPYSGGVNGGGQLGLDAGGKFGPIAANAQISGAFRWDWRPKYLQVASGAAGTHAFAWFMPKREGQYYIGRIPVELAIQNATSVRSFTLAISPAILFTGRTYSHIQVGYDPVRVLVTLLDSN